MSRRVSSNVPLEEPRLWEVTVPNWDKTYDHQRGDEEWENTLVSAQSILAYGIRIVVALLLTI